jgi:hypothetical protein
MSTFAEFSPTDTFTPQAILEACFERDEQAVLIDRDALPPEFFDLRTKLAGELAQRLTVYGVRLACVVPDLSSQSERFVEYARESNRGERIRFFESREAAEDWLATGFKDH